MQTLLRKRKWTLPNGLSAAASGGMDAFAAPRCVGVPVGAGWCFARSVAERRQRGCREAWFHVKRTGNDAPP
jgi:hypothetical protein